VIDVDRDPTREGAIEEKASHDVGGVEELPLTGEGGA
jgi:hypothetical protein